jgi:hypothetical protein
MRKSILTVEKQYLVQFFPKSKPAVQELASAQGDKELFPKPERANTRDTLCKEICLFGFAKRILSAQYFYSFDDCHAPGKLFSRVCPPKRDNTPQRE